MSAQLAQLPSAATQALLYPYQQGQRPYSATLNYNQSNCWVNYLLIILLIIIIVLVILCWPKHKKYGANYGASAEMHDYKYHRY